MITLSIEQNTMYKYYVVLINKSLAQSKTRKS